MAEHAEMLTYARQSPQDAEFIALPADTDELSRQRFAVRLAPHVNDLNTRYPWLRDPGAGSVRGSAFAHSVIGEAIRELYNPAQRDVLRRVNEILYPGQTSTLTQWLVPSVPLRMPTATARGQDRTDR